LAISPDGRQIAANVWTNSGSLWIAPLDGSPPKPLAGGEGGTTPFWSPDSSTIGFFRGQLSQAAELVTISANGGPVTRVASLTLGGAAGGSWNAKGVIVFSLSGKIFRVQATGGDPVELPLAGIKGTARSPAFLSDGQHFIVCAERTLGGSIYLASLDDGHAIELGESDCPGGVAPPDYVLFLRHGSLVAQKLDLRRPGLVGDTRVVATGVTRGALGPWPQLTPSASNTGVLVVPAVRGGSPLGQLTWFDRNGKPTSAIDLPAEPGAEYLNPAISPANEKLVAANRMDPQSGAWHIWIIDGTRGNASSRLTTDPSADRDPAWSPDGQEIIYASDRSGEWAFYRQRYAGGAAVPLPVDLHDAIQPMPSDWTTDGRLLFSHLQRSIWSVLLGDRDPRALGDPQTGAYGPHLSLDGNWLAYGAAPDRRRFEVFVERFPSGSPRRQITTLGGAHPRWTHTARGIELVYWSVTEGVVSVPLSLSDQAIQIGATHVLVPQVLSLIDARTAYDISRDGQRILVREPAGQPSAGIRVIVNWMAKLK
jgi:WD40 repeat protein